MSFAPVLGEKNGCEFADDVPSFKLESSSLGVSIDVSECPSSDPFTL
jgi:hypothetical protein